MKTATPTITQSWEDIVFENRNKDYGAYLNRKSYSKSVVIAALITFLVLIFVLAFPAIKEFFGSLGDKEEVVVKNTTVVSLDQPPPITPNQPPPPDIRIPPPVKTIIKFLPPKVTEKEVVEEEEMPTIEEIKQNETGSEEVQGDVTTTFEEPAPAVVEEDVNKVFLVVEQPPEFDGGLEAMYKFISKNMKYPASARRMNIEGSVFVGFVVDADGKISEASIIKGISADCDKEALRVVQMMPKWRPGKQSGRPVRVKFVLPIKFKLD
jgi:periplasmic protein TonB